MTLHLQQRHLLRPPPARHPLVPQTSIYLASDARGFWGFAIAGAMGVGDHTVYVGYADGDQ